MIKKYVQPILWTLAFVLILPAALDARSTDDGSAFIQALRDSSRISDPAAIAYLVVGDQQVGFVLAREASTRLGSGAEPNLRDAGGLLLGEILVPRPDGVVEGGCIPYPVWLRQLRGSYQAIARNQDGKAVARVSLAPADVEAMFRSQTTNLRDTKDEKPKPSEVIRKIAAVLEKVADLLETLGHEIKGSSGTWTDWLNRDRPGGAGDFETLKDFLAEGKACTAPQAIECETRDGRDWSDANQVYKCDPNVGGVCRNADQDEGRCLDYRVRFFCP